MVTEPECVTIRILYVKPFSLMFRINIVLFVFVLFEGLYIFSCMQYQETALFSYSHEHYQQRATSNV